MTTRILGVVFIALCSAMPALAYEIATHRSLSELAFTQSDVNNNETLRDSLGLDKPLVETLFPSTEGKPVKVIELVSLGAEDEDDLLSIPPFRPIHHFFDPYYRRSLTIGVPTHASPDWILEDHYEVTGQKFSYRDAKDYFSLALSSSTKQDRDKNWGLLFESLGHVIHHVQDMAQPQHVRNDAHLPLPAIGDKSIYEGCTDSAVTKPGDPGGCGVPLAVTQYPRVTLPKARDFWTTYRGVGSSFTNTLGLADFTNRNFVSKDTNFEIRNGQPGPNPRSGFSLPQPAGSHTKTLEELGAPNAAETCERLKNNSRARGVPNAKCEIEFYATDIYDAYTATSSANERASSLSIFDQYLELRENLQGYKTDRLFTLNRFNYAAAHPFLIPRAVAYSAGLINHFFRGRMELESAEAEAGQIRIEIKNTSEAGNAFGPGMFTIYYDSSDGARKPLAIETGSELGAGQLSPGGTHTLVIEPPEDLDMKVATPFALIYKGIICAEEAVSGLVLDAPDAYQGFFFDVDAFDISDRVEGPRLIYRKNGQWKLHPQGNLPAGGAVDWKGWYKNGKPARILTWAGNRYGTGNYSAGISRGGKLFAAAPLPVLGAALQKDADGKEWVIAICEGADKDIVFKRPAKRSGSAALYDPNSAPEGWRKIGEFSNPSDLSSFRRPWLFNGDGTEAQTMRERKRDYEYERKPLTRLKITTDAISASFADLGNTKVIRRIASSADYNCRPGSGGASVQRAETISGESIFAVDYIDALEVLARIQVEGTSTAKDIASSDAYGAYTATISEFARLKWTLRFGALNYEMVNIAFDSSTTVTNLHNNSGSGSSQSESSRSVALVAVDLRSNFLAANISHREGRYQAAADEGTPYGDTDDKGSITNTSSSEHKIVAGNALDVAFETVSPTTNSSRTSFNWFVVPTVGKHCAGDEAGSEEDYSVHQESEVLASPEVFGVANVSAAFDREGNFFISFPHENRYFNFLSGDDPVAVTRIDPARPKFQSIGPK